MSDLTIDRTAATDMHAFGLAWAAMVRAEEGDQNAPVDDLSATLERRLRAFCPSMDEPEQVAAWMAVSLVRGETAPYRGAASGEALCDYRTGTSLRVAVWTEVVQSMAAGETGAFRCEDCLGRGQTVYVELG